MDRDGSFIPPGAVKLPPPAPPMKILVADDDELIRAILKKILRDWNLDVYEAANGVEALKILENEPGIRLIILDLAMPVMDGLELCRRLQGNPDSPYILIFTGTAPDEETRRTILDAGANDFLTKPFVPDMLWWKLQAASRFLKDVDYAKAIASMRILIADDDQNYRAVLQTVLMRWHHEVLSAPDGTEASGLLDQNDNIQVVILDWNMPGMTGLDICRSLRAKDRAPYILMASGKHTDLDIQAAMKAGANDYLCKPFTVEMLQARLRAAARFMGLTIATA